VVADSYDELVINISNGYTHLSEYSGFFFYLMLQFIMAFLRQLGANEGNFALTWNAGIPHQT
jgi:hypothetical protein